MQYTSRVKKSTYLHPMIKVHLNVTDVPLKLPWFIKDYVN